MAIVKSLIILLRGNTGKLKGDFKPAKKALKDLQGSAVSVFRGVSFKIAGLAGAVVGVTSLATAMLKVNKQFTAIDEIAKSADKIGATVGEMQSLKLAAELAGSSFETTEKAMLKMSQTLGKAIGGDVTAIKSLEKLGLTIDNFAGLGATQSLGLVSDSINKLGSQSEKTAATMEIFGRGGAEIFNLIQGGSAAINAASADIASFGGELSRVDAAKVEMANDAWTRMQTMLDMVFQQLALGVAPAFTAMIEIVTELAKSTGVVGSISTVVFDTIIAGVEIASRSFSFMSGVIRTVQMTFTGFSAVFLQGLAMIESALISIGGKTFDFGIKAIADAATVATQELASMAGENFNQAFGTNDFSNDFKKRMQEIQGRAEDIAANVEDSIFAKPLEPKVDIKPAAINTQSAGRGSQEAFAAIFGATSPMDAVVAVVETGNDILSAIREEITRRPLSTMAVAGDQL